MSATLYPGIKSLHLVLDRPYDTIRTDDVRDDLIGVKVWYSTTPGFDPQLGQGTLAFDGGAGLSVVISGLETNTQYYVKYAFISAIDPTVYTVSSQLSSIVYDENVTVYGYLTNDPTNVATDSSGAGGNYAASTAGVFKVYNLSQDVTGNGPVYAVKPNSATGGLQALINSTTGEYYATGMTSDIALVVFTATYNNVVIERVWNVNKSKAGVDGTSAASLRLSGSGTTFAYKDDFASTTTSATITIRSTLQNISGTPTYTAAAYTREGTLLGPISFTTDGIDITISSEQFNPASYNNTVGYVNISATLNGASDTFTINRTNDGSEQIVVEQSNSTHTITAYADGTVPAANYAGSGNIIRVLQGSKYLDVDNTSPYSPGTWRITNIVSSGITADTTPTIGSDYENFDTHSAMTGDTAFIEYTITGLTTTSKPFTKTVKQTFSKSKAGVAGSNAPLVTLTASTQAFVVAKNTGTVSPTNTVLLATPSNLTSPTYVWKVDDVVQAGQTTNTFTLASFTGLSKLVRVEATSGTDTVFDQLTIFSLKEGDDAIQAALENENQTISCDSTGEPLAGQLPITSKMVVVRGSENLTSGVVFSKVSDTNLTSTINSTTGAISVTAITANAGKAVYRATIGTTVIDKVLSVNKTLNGAKGADGAPGANGTSAPAIDISGYGVFYRNAGGLITPSTMTLQAVVVNVTSPSYTWTITGATPTTATGSSVTITPIGNTSVTITLSVTGSNLSTALSISRVSNVVDQGAVGQAGQNGVMSAYPSIYVWTSGTAPARPTVTSTYTWATGAYTAPSGWTTYASTNTTAGYVLWELTVPLNVVATTTTSTLDWTNTAYLIRAITANGTNGAAGATGATGATGAAGANGSDGAPGSATYLIDRGSSSSSSAPTYSEVYAATGYVRYAVTGDIATIRYNSGNNSIAYRATSSGTGASWATQSTYITGSLIVQNSISGDRITAGTLTVDRLTSGNSTLSGGVFGLGGNDTLNGYTAIGRFSRTTSGFTFMAYQDNSGDSNAAIAGSHLSFSGWAAIGYNTYSSSYNSFRTVGALGSGGQGFLARYLRNIGSAGNAGGGSVTGCGAAYSGTAIYGEYNGSSASYPLTTGHIGDISWGAVLRRYTGNGISSSDYITELLCAGPNYSAYGTKGKMYAVEGFTPFTGVHDGVVSVDNVTTISGGDILIDKEVLQHLDLSNSIVELEISSQANQKGVIGVLVEVHDTVPVDWLQYQHKTQHITDPMNLENIIPEPPLQDNPQYFELADLYKVVNVNALGEGLINVCGENGNLEKGDLIVTSSIPGKGMKQNDDIIRSYTVAKTREAVTFSSPTEVKQVACIYLCG